MLAPRDKPRAARASFPAARFYTVTTVEEGGVEQQVGEELTSRQEAVAIARWRGGTAWAHGCFPSATRWVRWRVWS